MIYMKKVFSFLSACLIFISCFAFNASAEDDPLIDPSVANFPVYYNDVCERLSKRYGVSDPSSLDYIYFYYGSNDYQFIIIPPDLPLGDGVYFGNVFNESSRMIIFGEETYNSLNNGFTSYTGFNNLFVFSKDSVSSFSLSNTKTVDNEIFLYKYLGHPEAPVYSSVSVFDFSSRELIIEPPSSGIPEPYTITYNPNLSLNMERETDLMTINTVDVTVHLNKDFIDWYIKRSYEAAIPTGNNNFGAADDLSVSDILGSESGGAASIDISNCGRSESLFFITSSDVNSSLYDCTYSSVYTYLSDQRYSIVDKQSGQIDGSTSTAVYANGYYPYFDLAFEQLSSLTSLSLSQYNKIINSDISYTFTVDLRQINWEQIMQNRQTNGLENIDFPLECVLTSNVRYLPEGNSDYNSAFNEFYGFTSNGYDSETGQSQTSFGNLFDTFSTESSYSDHILKEGLKDSPWYIYTKDFSFTDSLPDYVPLKDSDGNELDVSGNSGNLAKNPPKPSSYQSVDQDGNLSKKRTEQEQLDYDRSFKLANNFANTDFSDFGSIFETGGSYFQFLTSALTVLPDWFLVIFTAFFTLLLALALIKFILD